MSNDDYCIECGELTNNSIEVDGETICIDCWLKKQKHKG